MCMKLPINLFFPVVLYLTKHRGHLHYLTYHRRWLLSHEFPSDVIRKYNLVNMSCSEFRFVELKKKKKKKENLLCTHCNSPLHITAVQHLKEIFKKMNQLHFTIFLIMIRTCVNQSSTFFIKICITTTSTTTFKSS